MSSTYRQIFYHLVFATKNREAAITEAHCLSLYRYIWGIVQNNQCRLYRINGVADHLHLLTDLHPSIALADLVRDIKARSSTWMKRSGNFPDFSGWQDGYSAFTCSVFEREAVEAYIRKQKEHHAQEGSVKELKRLLAEQQIAYDDKFLP